MVARLLRLRNDGERSGEIGKVNIIKAFRLCMERYGTAWLQFLFFFFFVVALARCIFGWRYSDSRVHVLDAASRCHVAYGCAMTSILFERFYWMQTSILHTREECPVAHARPIRSARISISLPTALPYVKHTPTLAIEPRHAPPFACI